MDKNRKNRLANFIEGITNTGILMVTVLFTLFASVVIGLSGEAGTDSWPGEDEWL